jgi:DmsE family decaheme c-type cytochrome
MMSKSVYLSVALAAVLFLGGDLAAKDECRACHQVLDPATMEALDQSGHGTTLSCTDCHGESSGHAKSPKTIAASQTFQRGSDGRDGSCVSCHRKEAPHWPGSSHATAGLACNDCHQAHAALDTRNTTEQASCLSCHASVRASLNLPSRHPIQEGKTECSDCHDPHGSMTPADLTGMTLNDSCLVCHENLRGPFLFEHQPVSEDCSLCHQPHGSVHDPLLKTRGPLICQQCHMAAFHPSRLEGGTGLLQGRASASLLGKNCLNCHPKVHGTNHPSGARLTR